MLEPVAAEVDTKPKAYLPPFRTAEPAEAKVSFVRRPPPSGAAKVTAGAEAKAAAGSDRFVPQPGPPKRRRWRSSTPRCGVS